MVCASLPRDSTESDRPEPYPAVRYVLLVSAVINQNSRERINWPAIDHCTLPGELSCVPEGPPNVQIASLPNSRPSVQPPGNSC